jgi:hypothetical protein
MDMHLPKVPHGWRELAKEIAIIVVGVLIALFAEQIVQGWEWRHKVSVARASMRHELLWDDGPQVYQRAAMHPCVVAQLDRIRAATVGSGSRREIAQLIDGYWVSIRTYDRLALDAANSSDVDSHMPVGELDVMSSAYQAMPLLERTNAQEATDWAHLRAFRPSGAAVSDEERDRLLGAVEALRTEDALMAQAARIKLPEIIRLGPLDRDRVRQFMNDAREHYGACVKDLPADFPKGVGD